MVKLWSNQNKRGMRSRSLDNRSWIVADLRDDGSPRFYSYRHLSYHYHHYHYHHHCFGSMMRMHPTAAPFASSPPARTRPGPADGSMDSDRSGPHRASSDSDRYPSDSDRASSDSDRYSSGPARVPSGPARSRDTKEATLLFLRDERKFVVCACGNLLCVCVEICCFCVCVCCSVVMFVQPRLQGGDAALPGPARARGLHPRPHAGDPPPPSLPRPLLSTLHSRPSPPSEAHTLALGPVPGSGPPPPWSWTAGVAAGVVAAGVVAAGLGHRPSRCAHTAPPPARMAGRRGAFGRTPVEGKGWPSTV